MKDKVKSTLSEYQDFIIKILITLGFIGIGFFLYSIKSLILILFFSIILAILFSPFLNKMEKYHIPTILGIIFIYLVLIIFLFVAGFTIIPIFAEQIQNLFWVLSSNISQRQSSYNENGIQGLPLPDFIISYLSSILQSIEFNSLFESLKSNFKSIGKFVWDFTLWWLQIISSITNSVITLVMVFIFNFFILIERKNIRKFFFEIIPSKLSNYLQFRENDIVNTFYYWLKWQIILAILMFFITLIWLSIVNFLIVDIGKIFALSLIVGMMEFIPVIWPLLALLPAIAVASSSWFIAIISVLIVYLIIQQIEGNILVPKVMGQALKLSPFLVLLMMTIWGSIYWILGIILSMPFAAILKIFVLDYLKNKN